MPISAAKACLHPGCRATTKRGYCAEHARQRRQQRRCDDPSDDFYASRRWRRFRALQLRESPLCIACLEEGRSVVAVHVDHIKTRRERPDLEFDSSNVQSLCHSCHSRKTRREQRDR